MEDAAGSGSGGGSYVINITDNGDETFRSDKTFAQISEAIASGKEAVCVFGAYHYQLVINTDTKLLFTVSELDGAIAYRTFVFDNSNGDNEITYKFGMPGYQYSVDGNLETEDITVVGAINEVNRNVNKLSNNGTVISENADFAEVAEWSDGNPNDEDRIGYFVSVDTSEAGKTMVKATSSSDVRGVTMLQPAFAGNASTDKYDSDGNLLKQYDYVGFAGFVPVIDNGTCTVNGRCMPADDGTAVPSSNNLGYQVIERIDSTHVIVLVEPQADMMVRIKEDIKELSENKAEQTEVDELKGDLNDHEERISALENGTGQGGSGSMSDALINAFADYIDHAIPNFDDANGMAYRNNLLALLRGQTPVDPTPDEPTQPTLTSISVTWSADSADVGTNPSTLISSVKANYSDGTSQNVTGYTVSPSVLVEGANTVTVTYQGESATKSITGISQTEPSGTIYFGSDDTYEKLAGSYRKDGVVVLTSNARYKHVELPYREGMTIYTYINSGTVNDYPPVVLFNGDAFDSVPTHEQISTAINVANFKVVLTGQSGKKVYVNMLGTSAGVVADDNKFYCEL